MDVEIFIGVIPLVQTSLMALSAFFYMLGGRSHKWLRRYVASFIATVSVVGGDYLLHRDSIIQWLLYPALIITFVLGYSGETPLARLKRRFIRAVVGFGSTTIILYLANGPAISLMIPFHAAAAAFTVFAGIAHIYPAAQEEFLIGFMTVWPLILYSMMR